MCGTAAPARAHSALPYQTPAGRGPVWERTMERAWLR
jgi:hypothetical protein